MAERLIQEETLQNIGNAIREMTGGTEGIDPVDMPDAIRGITTGIDTSDATATAAHILSGKTAYVNGGKVTGNIPSQGAQTITPSTYNKTIGSGKYLSGTQTIKGDANLKAENIKQGVSIFGVSGTCAGNVYYVVDQEISEKISYTINTGFKAKGFFLFSDTTYGSDSYRYDIVSIVADASNYFRSGFFDNKNGEYMVDGAVSSKISSIVFGSTSIQITLKSTAALNGKYNIYVYG